MTGLFLLTSADAHGMVVFLLIARLYGDLEGGP